MWRYYRYSLIYEFFDRPTLAAPLIVFNHMARLVKFTCRKCQREEKISHDFSESHNEDGKSLQPNHGLVHVNRPVVDTCITYLSHTDCVAAGGR